MCHLKQQQVKQGHRLVLLRSSSVVCETLSAATFQVSICLAFTHLELSGTAKPGNAHLGHDAGVQVACEAQVTELLWMKQTQLEQLAGEKAALQLSLERSLASAREDAEQVKRVGPYLDLTKGHMRSPCSHSCDCIRNLNIGQATCQPDCPPSTSRSPLSDPTSMQFCTEISS